MTPSGAPRSPSSATPSDHASRDRQGRKFLAFLPAISTDALKRIGGVLRHWRLHRRIFHTFEELAATINPVVAGWMKYYCRFYRSALYRLLARINSYLVRWIRHRYRRLAGVRTARLRFAELVQATPTLFTHWMGPHRLVTRMTRAR